MSVEETEALLSEPEISELFAADPSKLSDFEFRKLVLHYRAERKNWTVLEAKGKGAKAAKASAPAVVSLEDLGLG